MYQVASSKSHALEQLSMLVEAYSDQKDLFSGSGYKESQLRNDFLNPLLKTFGWDVDNESRKPQILRDVVQEEELEVEEDDTAKMKNPDYTLRVNGIRSMFIEAKKAAIDIAHSKYPAFQTRRYGWSANLNLSVLTNFNRLVVYDCRTKPDADDEAPVARYRSYHYTEFVDKFEEIYALLSFESISNGGIDELFSQEPRSTTPFDSFFLSQIVDWRKRLAKSIISNNSSLNQEEINFQIQRLLNRIIFLRICEDRKIEEYHTLHEVSSYEELKLLFSKADTKYNSGLFDFIEDELSLRIILDSQLLIDIFNELYYPKSPYDFSVVDPEILSQIYERFLGSRIAVTEDGEVAVVEEPEVAASDGVVPTPKLVVRKIVRDTLSHLIDSKSFEQILQLKIADISCGSGTFLISAYDYLLEHLSGLVEHTHLRNGLARLGVGNNLQLSLKCKQTIMLQCLYGVDINPYAVEVTRFSLSLKLLEGENAATVANHLSYKGAKVLPSFNESILCGNSLVDEDYYTFNEDALDDDSLRYSIRPFRWNDEFSFLGASGGFDGVIGNPPYVRIQHMVEYAQEEVDYYRSTTADYQVTGRGSSFDKYYLFIQRALTLLKPSGYLGYIIPNKFFTLKGAKSLREYIQANSSLVKIIHFGVLQLFPGRLTYTAIVILSKASHSTFSFTRVRNLSHELLMEPVGSQYPVNAFTHEPWLFVSPDTKALFERLYAGNTIPLKNISDIPVGLQNSKNDVYIIQPKGEQSAATFRFQDKRGSSWEIERDICLPCLKKVIFQPFGTIVPNAYMIFPYVAVGNNISLLDESDFQERFPLCWSYLSSHREELERRKIKGDVDPNTGIPYWYQFGRRQSLNRFLNTPKILFPVLSKEVKYVYDTNNLLFTGGGSGPYNSIISTSDYSLLYIMAILSHPVFEGMVKSRTSEFNGGYYSHGKQFIQNLPIRKIDFRIAAEKNFHDELVKTVTTMIAAVETLKAETIQANKRILNRKIKQLREKMIREVDELYSLSEVDRNIVAGDELLYGPLNDNNTD